MIKSIYYMDELKKKLIDILLTHKIIQEELELARYEADDLLILGKDKLNDNEKNILIDYFLTKNDKDLAIKLLDKLSGKTIKIENKQWLKIFKKSDLNSQSYFNNDVLMASILYFFTDKACQFDQKIWKYLIKNSNLKNKNKTNNNALMMLINAGNILQDLKLAKSDWELLIKNSDLKLINNFNSTALIFAVKYLSNQLNNESWQYLLENSDLNVFDKTNANALIYALSKPDSFDYLDYLIEHTNLSGHSCDRILKAAIVNEVKLSKAQWDKLIEETPLTHISSWSEVSLAYVMMKIKNSIGLDQEQELKLLRKDNIIVYDSLEKNWGINKEYQRYYKVAKRNEEHLATLQSFLDEINIRNTLIDNKTKIKNKI